MLSTYHPFLPVSFESFLEIVKSTYPDIYMPVTKLAWILIITPMQYFAGNRWATENWVQPFIIFGIMIHFANCLLIKALLPKLFPDRATIPNWKQWLVVFLYALHPLQVESLQSASMLREPLWIFFALLSVNFFLEKKLVTSFLWFFLAAFAKPTAVILFPLLLLLLYANSEHRTVYIQKAKLTYFIAMFCVASVVAFIAHSIQRHPEFNISMWDRIYYSFETFGFYISKILYPSQLNPDYGRSYAWLMKQGWTTNVLVFLTFILMTSFVLYKFPNKRREALILLGFFFLPLIPVSGLSSFAMQQYSNVADRYVSFSIIAFSGLAYLYFVRSKFGTLMCILLCLAYAGKSFNQKHIWTNNQTLSAYIISVNPQSFMAYNNLGVQYSREGNDSDAISAFAKAIDLNPFVQNSYINYGSVLASQGKIEAAESILNEGYLKNPNSLEICLHLSALLEKLAKFDRAKDILLSAKLKFPANPLVYYSLGRIYLQQQLFQQAALEFERASELDPQNPKYREGYDLAKELGKK